MLDDKVQKNINSYSILIDWHQRQMEKHRIKIEELKRKLVNKNEKQKSNKRSDCKE